MQVYPQFQLRLYHRSLSSIGSEVRIRNRRSQDLLQNSQKINSSQTSCDHREPPLPQLVRGIDFILNFDSRWSPNRNRIPCRDPLLGGTRQVACVALGRKNKKNMNIDNGHFFFLHIYVFFKDSIKIFALKRKIYLATGLLGTRTFDIQEDSFRIPYTFPKKGILYTP